MFIFQRSPIFYTEGEEGGSSGGSGPEPIDDQQRRLLSQGFRTLSFGLAIGVAFVVLYLMIYFNPFWVDDNLQAFAQDVFPNLLLSFLYGVILGVTISAVYNLLLLKFRFLFGPEGE